MAPRTLGVLLIVVSATAFGALPIFARLAYAGGGDVTAVLFLRFAIAAVAMAAVLVVRRRPWPRPRLFVALLLMGGVGYVGQSFAYFTALTLIPATLVSLLLYAYPALVVLLAVLWLGERLTTVKTAALGIALVGAALTIGPELGGRRLGIVLGLSAAAIYAVYIVVGSRITPRAGPLPSAAVVMLGATAVYAVVVLVQRPAFPGSVGGWAAVLGLSLVSTVVAITTFFAGMDRLGAADTSTLSTLEPLVTVVLAAIVLDERVTAVQLTGGVLILAAVLLLARATPGSGRRVPAFTPADPTSGYPPT
ncbi:MAG: DMT family transporter [Actinobacteria bacterium]|nr:DMT family transporter [Actinomycetota bacterium]